MFVSSGLHRTTPVCCVDDDGVDAHSMLARLRTSFEIRNPMCCPYRTRTMAMRQ
jgi:hypothetical protein